MGGFPDSTARQVTEAKAIYLDDAMRFVVVLEPDDDVGGFNVSVPALPGCFTQGQTVADCLVRARDAIATYLDDQTEESLRAAGVDPEVVVEVVAVEIAAPV